jgi:predicted RNA-binding Zn-ribbon protein involved in translation (DUF1610 family)
MYPTNYTNEHKRQQHCSTCNAYVKFSSRYPTYVCQRCIKKAIDKKGRHVQFFNSDQIGRACIGRYIDNGNEYHTNYCWINGVKCKAEEAYLGGIVVYPVESRKTQSKASTNI